MTVNYCINLIDGTLCTNRATASGYCKKCDPVSTRKAEKELLQVRKEVAKKEMEKKQRDEQKQEIFNQNIEDMIASCCTIEDLRKLELKVIGALLDGTIDDPRVGSPVAQMLKHQEQLIEKNKPDSSQLGNSERDRAIALAKDMSMEQMLGLLGDLAHGMKKLAQQAKEQAPIITIEAKEVPENA